MLTKNNDRCCSESVSRRNATSLWSPNGLAVCDFYTFDGRELAMFVNLTSLEDGAHAEFCVIGSGPAGMTVARKLAEAGRKVFLFEGGGEDFSEESQDIYKGKVFSKGYRALDIVRLRFLGGTSNHWNGGCLPMAAETFQPRRSVPLGEWPIDKEDLDLYADEAQDILDIKFNDPSGKFFLNDPNSNLQKATFAISNSTVTNSHTRFGIKYYDDLEHNNSLYVFLNSNLVDLDTNGERVTAARFSNYEGVSRIVRANTYVLATGGIENIRILLHNNVRQNGRLVKLSNTLGKYFMDHPHFNVGSVAIFPKNVGDFRESATSGEGGYYLSNDFRKRHNMVNITPIFHFDRIKEDEIKFLRSQLKALFYSYNAKKIKFYSILGGLEMIPRKENSIFLIDEKDRFNITRIGLSISMSKEEYHATRIFCTFFGRYLIDKGIGRLKIPHKIWNNEYKPILGYHQMGGTRMAGSAEWGVVDKNCLVFGQKNLYIAGSSVFPSADTVNPTYTIVQLALRLSHHLLGLRA